MRIDLLPVWARTALKNGPVFGSDEEGDGGAGAGNGGGDGKPAGEGTGNEGAGKPNAEENKAPQLTEAQIAKLISDGEAAKATIAGYEKDKLERERAAEEAERATRSKEENLQKDVDRLTDENSKMKIVNERNLLDLAILRNTNYQWHDANDVAALLDRSGIKIDASTGNVEGVDDALKELAKAKPHLLKQKENENENGGNGSGLGGGPLGGQPSGGKPGTGNGQKATKRKELVGRFSVLNI